MSHNSSSSMIPAAQAPTAKRPLTQADWDHWRSITGPVLSSDGRWAAYTLVPQVGDGELIVRATQGTTEYRVPRGYLGRPNNIPGGLRPPAGANPEVEPAGGADQGAHLLLVGHAGDLDHDAVAALCLHDRLGHAELVDAVLDDRPDVGQRVGRDRHAVRRHGAVLAAQAALEVEPEARIDLGRRVAERPVEWREVDRDRGEADHQDDKGKEPAHSAGMLAARHDPAPPSAGQAFSAAWIVSASAREMPGTAAISSIVAERI